MSTDLTIPERRELEALNLAERVAMEGALEEALPLLRELNDAEIRRLHEAGASQRAIAEAMGVSQTTARSRLVRMGLTGGSDPNVKVSGPTQPIPQTEDSRISEFGFDADHDAQGRAYDDDPPEVVDGEVVDDDTPDAPTESSTDSELKAEKVRCPTCGHMVKPDDFKRGI